MSPICFNNYNKFVATIKRQVSIFGRVTYALKLWELFKLWYMINICGIWHNISSNFYKSHFSYNSRFDQNMGRKRQNDTHRGFIPITNRTWLISKVDGHSSEWNLQRSEPFDSISFQIEVFSLNFNTIRNILIQIGRNKF